MNAATAVPPTELALRFALTFLVAFAFGYARQRGHKPIGFGTFIFVATGACALALTAVNLAPANPLPLLGAVVTGIGFLGAGALIKSGDQIQGFTSAASIWAYAIVGVTIGVGEYTVGLTLYALTWFVLLFDARLERIGFGAYRRRLTVRVREPGTLELVQSELAALGAWRRLEYRLDRGAGDVAAVFALQGGGERLEALLARLGRLDGLSAIELV
jgi:putative Mg2+ transporter-C (MgtC) family protein